MPIDKAALKPTNKVKVGAAVGSFVTLLVAITEWLANIQVPADIALGLTTVLIFALQYWTRDVA